MTTRYYSEEVAAPILTIFVGGNHEASNYLQELPYGGWVAPNIWYMGESCAKDVRLLARLRGDLMQAHLILPFLGVYSNLHDYLDSDERFWIPLFQIYDFITV